MGICVIHSCFKYVYSLKCTFKVGVMNLFNLLVKATPP